MGFVTNEWLKEMPKRNRPHLPIDATIKFEHQPDEWSENNGVVCEIQVVDKTDWRYQIVYLTDQDAKDALSVLFDIVEPDDLEPLVIKALSKQSDKSLLRLLRSVLERREKQRNG
jgi:hypothetical protein